MDVTDFSLDNWKVACDIKNEYAVATIAKHEDYIKCLQTYPELKSLFIKNVGNTVILNLDKLQSLDPFKYNDKVYSDIQFHLGKELDGWFLYLVKPNQRFFDIQSCMLHDGFQSANGLGSTYNKNTYSVIKERQLRLTKKLIEVRTEYVKAKTQVEEVDQLLRMINKQSKIINNEE